VGFGVWATRIGVLASTITSILVLLKTFDLRKSVQEVHVLVNSQLTAVVNYVGTLTDTLKDAGVPVPPVPPKETDIP
jgi:hypothetical protein